jgi:hypothetical protein
MEGKMSQKAVNLAIALVFSISLSVPNHPITAPVGSDALEQELKIIREFPSEEQMIRDDYVLGKNGLFDWDEECIYFCSQRQHAVFIMDFEGNLIHRLGGRSGQGPGELNFPVRVRVYDNKLYVFDTMNGRIQVFDKKGTYLRQIRMIETMVDAAFLKKSFFCTSFLEPNPGLKRALCFSVSMI